MTAALSGAWRDSSSQAFDPESAPDPRLRLRLLTATIGSLCRAWRSRVDRFPIAELDRELMRHPDYATAASNARGRYRAWQTQQGNGSSVPPERPVRWEYMFDGLLTFDSGDDDGPMARFIHPVLGEFVLATYLAGLGDDELTTAVEAHRWFDASWEQVWPLAAELMSEPDHLVRTVLDSPYDAWREQTLLACSCLLGGRDRVSEDLAGQVVVAILGMVRSRLPLDRNRALGRLRELVRANVVGVIEATKDLLGEVDLPRRSRLAVAAMLAEVGEELGLVAARSMVSDQAIPASHRAWLATSVVIAQDDAGIDGVRTAVRQARTVSELRRLVAAVPVESKPGGDLVFTVLRDHSAPMVIRLEAGRALNRTGDPDRICAVTKVAKDKGITPPELSAALIAELIALGESGLSSDGIRLCQDPNVSDDTLAQLLESLVRSGVTEVLPKAISMLTSANVSWQPRRRIARVIAELGEAGIARLRDLVESALPIELKLRIFVALVEFGQAWDMANHVVDNSGVPTWIRSRLARTLLAAGDRSVEVGILRSLVSAQEDHSFKEELIIEMAGRDLAGADQAAVDLLINRPGRATDAYAGRGPFLTGLAQAGHGGAIVLRAIIEHEKVAQEDRALAILGLAESEPAAAGALAKRYLDGFSTFIRAQLALLLAEKGVHEVRDEVISLLAVDPAAITALHTLLSSPRVKLFMVQELIVLDTTVDGTVGPDPVAHLSIDDKVLRESGLTWSSDVERELLRQKVYSDLEQRVGTMITAFLTFDQIDEFGDLDNKEEQTEFLHSRASGYRDLIVELLERLQQDIRADPEVYRVEIDAKASELGRIVYVARILNEWRQLAESKRISEFGKFLVVNRTVICSPVALDVLQIARRLSSSRDPWDAMYHLRHLAVTDDMTAAHRLVSEPGHLHNRLRTLLADGEGVALFYTGTVGILAQPTDPSTYFYTALGAAIEGSDDLCRETMRLSNYYADDGRRAQGRETILREGRRLGLREELIQELTEILANEQSKTDMRDPGDGS